MRGLQHSVNRRPFSGVNQRGALLDRHAVARNRTAKGRFGFNVREARIHGETRVSV